MSQCGATSDRQKHQDSDSALYSGSIICTSSPARPASASPLQSDDPDNDGDGDKAGSGRVGYRRHPTQAWHALPSFDREPKCTEGIMKLTLPKAGREEVCGFGHCQILSLFPEA